MTIKVKKVIGVNSVELEGETSEILKYEILSEIDQQLLGADAEVVENILKFRKMIEEQVIK